MKPPLVPRFFPVSSTVYVQNHPLLRAIESGATYPPQQKITNALGLDIFLIDLAMIKRPADRLRSYLSNNFPPMRFRVYITVRVQK